LILDPPREPAVGSFDPGRLGPALDDLVAWRAKACPPGCDVRLSWRGGEGAFHVLWRERLYRSSAADVGHPPEGGGGAPAHLALLALPVLTRVLPLHGGSVEVAEHEGWQLHMRWPLDLGTTSPDTS